MDEGAGSDRLGTETDDAQNDGDAEEEEDGEPGVAELGRVNEGEKQAGEDGRENDGGAGRRCGNGAPGGEGFHIAGETAEIGGDGEGG